MADAARPVAIELAPAKPAANLLARVQDGRLVRVNETDAGGAAGPERIAAGGGSDRMGFVSAPGVFAAGVMSQEQGVRASQLAQQMARTQLMLERQQRLALQPGLPAEAKQALEADVARLKVQLANLTEAQRKITLEPQRDNADLIAP